MAFTSLTYFVFLALTVGAVRVTRGVAREWVLLGASFVFYGFWDLRFVPVLLTLGAGTYLAGRRLAANRKDRAWLVFPVAAILAVLGIFKYSGMVVSLANWLLPDALRITLPSIILPLGISFYTFECVSYLLDVHQGSPGLTPFRRFLLFPAFFPHLIAGPILRVKEFGPQLDKLEAPSDAESVAGIDRILIGLLKKVLLANTLGTFVDQGFSAAKNSALDNWSLAFAFGLQIYFDFSAYTDIAIGSSRLVGLKLPENFNLPYHARNPSDFWNRWHITLSRWIRDYLFFPLNLKAGRRIWLRYVYLVEVMTLVGLWHGAGLGFILWGAWHGVLMVGHRVLESRIKRVPKAVARVAGLVGPAITFILVNAAWILFRAPTIGQSSSMLASMFSLKGLRPAFSVNDYMILAFAMGFYFVLEPWLKRIGERTGSAVAAERLVFWARPAFYGASLMLLFMFDRSNVAFIYFQF
jgi:alginate O-acetyltransferase complex protein AlgI